VDGRALLVVSLDRVTDEHNQMIETKLAEAMGLAREQRIDLAAAVAPRGQLFQVTTRRATGSYGT